MARGETDKTMGLFAERSLDLTPIKARHAVSIIYAPFSRDREVTKICTSLLTEVELKRVGRFTAEHDRENFTQRRAFRIFCGASALGFSRPFSNVIFRKTERGHPYLLDRPDIWFSFSSCRFGFLGAWSYTHAVGVDVEDVSIRCEVSALARGFFSVSEANTVERTGRNTFFQFWCLKEAALKSIGEGLPFGLDKFEFKLTPNLQVIRAPDEHGGPEKFGAYMIEGTENCAALITRKVI